MSPLFKTKQKQSCLPTSESNLLCKDVQILIMEIIKIIGVTIYNVTDIIKSK